MFGHSVTNNEYVLTKFLKPLLHPVWNKITSEKLQYAEEQYGQCHHV